MDRLDIAADLEQIADQIAELLAQAEQLLSGPEHRGILANAQAYWLDHARGAIEGRPYGGSMRSVISELRDNEFAEG